MNAGELAQALARQAETVARYLLPEGKRQGAEWCAGSTGGEPGQSLKVHLKGAKAGVWRDFATGVGGDLLDLWCAVRGLSIPAALDETRNYLGVRAPHFEGPARKDFKRPAVKGKLPTSQTPAGQYLTSRLLNGETIRAFKVREEQGVIVFPYWRDGELVFQKYLAIERVNGKKKTWTDADLEPCLFGWETIPATARQVTLCEGEIDAMTLHQYGFPALSVPFGGGGGDKQRWVEHEYDRLERFDTIYLCMDQDGEGEAATAELIKRLGRERCRVVELPCKDANACLQAGVQPEIMQAAFTGARALDPDELRPASHYVEDVIRAFYPEGGVEPGIGLPWSKSSRLRFRPDELVIWTGINGHGKSQILGHAMLHAAQQGERICIASMELKPRNLLMRLTRQACAMNQPSPEYIRAVHDWYDGKFWLFDVTGNTRTDRLLDVFTYARKRYGITQFVVDSLMKLGMAEDDYKGQKAFVDALCDFKARHDCTVHLVAHNRKGEDERHAPGKLDVKGTGAITDLADTCLSVWRNKIKEEKMQKAKTDEEREEQAEHPDALLSCDKQRNGDWEGKIALWFDRSSLQYLESERSRPTRFVPWSGLREVG